MRQSFALLSSVITAFILAGCKEKVSVATFIDSPVTGLEFYSATQSGVSDANGNFIYKEGEKITFHIGNLYFGSVEPKNGIITPLDLVHTESISDPRVVRMLQVLQTLDTDGNPDNGIIIDPALSVKLSTLPKIDLTESSTTDAAVLAMLGINAYSVTASEAQSNFELNAVSNASLGYTSPSTSPAPSALVSLPATYKANAGRLLGSQCAQCHGTNGISKNEWDSIAGESNLPDEIYQDDEPIMNAQAHGYTKEEIILIGNWLKTLKSNN